MLKKTVLIIVEIFSVILGIFIAYQITKHILGGSWTTEDIILALSLFNLSATFTIGITLATLKSDQHHLSKKFDALAKDFKGHIKR